MNLPSLLPRFRAPAMTMPSIAPSEAALLAGKHIPALDAVRGLAILMVTYYRFAGGSPGEAQVGEGLPLYAIGSRGVELFFVLSGFLITGILFDAKNQAHYFRNFYARRTLRIFPLYYGVLLAALVVLPLFDPSAAHRWFPEAEGNQAWLWLYGANILQSWRGEWCLGWFNHFWSLAIEEHYYLAWPLVVYWLSRRQALAACGLMFCASAASRVLFTAAGDNDVAPHVFTLFRLDAIALGSGIALAVRGPLGLRGLLRPATAGLIGSTAVLLGVWAIDRRLWTIPDTFWALFFGSALVLVLAAPAGSWRQRLGESRWLQFFGKYSYGMYVFQSLLIPVMAPVATAAGLAAWCGSDWMGQTVYLVVMSVATTAIALASWHLFEKHFLRLRVWFTAVGKSPIVASLRVS